LGGPFSQYSISEIRTSSNGTSAGSGAVSVSTFAVWGSVDISVHLLLDRRTWPASQFLVRSAIYSLGADDPPNVTNLTTPHIEER
jgi:hypothetical protein